MDEQILKLGCSGEFSLTVCDVHDFDVLHGGRDRKIDRCGPLCISYAQYLPRLVEDLILGCPCENIHTGGEFFCKLSGRHVTLRHRSPLCVEALNQNY